MIKYTGQLNQDLVGVPTSAEMQGDGSWATKVETLQAILSSVVTLQNAAAAVGVGTALTVSGAGVATLAVSGTFVATITWEGQGPDGNWYAINARNRSTGLIGGTATAAGLFEVNCRGLTAVRANITAYTSGAVTVKGVSQPLEAAADTVQVTGRKVALGSGSYGTALNVAGSGGLVTITITPPSGQLWRVRNMRFYLVAPTGALSGTHQLEVAGISGGGNEMLLKASSNYGDPINISYSMAYTATGVKYPTTDEAFGAALRSIVADAAHPLKLYYTNNTDAAQTGTPVIVVTQEVEYTV